MLSRSPRVAQENKVIRHERIVIAIAIRNVVNNRFEIEVNIITLILYNGMLKVFHILSGYRINFLNISPDNIQREILTKWTFHCSSNIIHCY